jgi:putative nucleotidyltransferase with HDIG domain
MDTVNGVMILAGAAIMVVNIIRFYRFLNQQSDILSAGDERTRKAEYVAYVLLILFLIGYVLTFLTYRRSTIIALILLGGSIFVAIVEIALFAQIDTIKTRTGEISEVMIDAIEARDPSLTGHSIHVRNLTELLYQYLPENLKSEINEVSLGYAALLHDIGKLGVPEAILNKKGKLTKEEWDVMMTHPKTGAKILSPIKAFREILPWIEYHHERMDGLGYYHLPGEKIPLGARIIAVVDTYSVITMRFPYKDPQSYEEAIRCMKQAAGSQLDPYLVDCFCRIPREEVEATVPENVDMPTFWNDVKNGKVTRKEAH